MSRNRAENIILFWNGTTKNHLNHFQITTCNLFIPTSKTPLSAERMNFGADSN